jgi:hypothetical protein
LRKRDLGRSVGIATPSEEQVKRQNAKGKAAARMATLQESHPWDSTFAIYVLPFDLFFRHLAFCLLPCSSAILSSAPESRAFPSFHQMRGGVVGYSHNGEHRIETPIRNVNAAIHDK